MLNNNEYLVTFKLYILHDKLYSLGLVTILVITLNVHLQLEHYKQGEEIFETDNLMKSVHFLSPYTNYTIWVTCLNSAGESGRSEKIHITTQMKGNNNIANVLTLSTLMSTRVDYSIVFSCFNCLA